MVEALKAAKRHRWPERHEGHRFLDRMVQLALDVEANPRLDGLVPLVVPAGEDKKGKPKYQRFPGWWCLRLPWMSEEVWRKWGEPKYALVRQPLDIWAGEAVRKCRKVLQDE